MRTALLVMSGLFVAISAGIMFHSCSVAAGVANKVVNPNSIVQNYEWFYDMKTQIDATRNKVIIAKGAPEEAGIKMVLESMIGEYNAKSRMISRNLWKSNELPYQIESEVSK